MNRVDAAVEGGGGSQQSDNNRNFGLFFLANFERASNFISRKHSLHTNLYFLSCNSEHNVI
jgi:hypothetical protein